MNKKLVAITGLLGIGVVGRLIPHLPNATPITSLAVAGERYVGKTWAIVLPLMAMLLSDIVIGFYNWRILFSVYISFAVIGFSARMLKNHMGFLPTGLFLVGSALIFFLITNFAVWVFSPWYEKSFSGLMYCYTLGLPFFRNMILGDVFYVSASVLLPKYWPIFTPFVKKIYEPIARTH